MSLKKIDSRSIVYKPLAEAIPAAKDIPGADSEEIAILDTGLQSMGATTEKIIKANYEFRYDFDEIFYVMDGPVIGELDGKTTTFDVGDIGVITKGTTIKWTIPTSSRTLSVTSPPVDAVLEVKK